MNRLAKFFNRGKSEPIGVPARETAQRERAVASWGSTIGVPEPPAWTEDDTIQFRKFLHTETGLRLVAKAKAMEYERAITLARDARAAQYSAGITTGIGDTIRWVLSLSELKFSGETAVQVSHNTADAEQDADALLKQWSP